MDINMFTGQSVSAADTGTALDDQERQGGHAQGLVHLG